MIASKWLKTLYNKAKKNKACGIGDINFFAQGNKKILGQFETKDYFGINFTTESTNILNKDKTFTISKEFKSTIKVVGVWVNADGDGSKSKFKLELNSIQLQRAP
jgi:hypothetical protein